MSATRIHSPYMLGATKWAAMRNPMTVTFVGISPETNSVLALKRLSFSLLRSNLAGASAVAAGSAGKAWVITTDGFLAGYTTATLALGGLADIQSDGNAIIATDTDVVYVSRTGGRISRVENYVPQYDAYLPHVALGFILGDNCIYALLENADLVVLTDDMLAETFRVVATLSLPASFGLRDMVIAGDSLFLVGTDRESTSSQGDGSVIEVDINDALNPSLVSVTRTLSPYLVLTTDGLGQVGTNLPQTPYTTPEVPWQGRTDCIRTAGDVLIARPSYGEVWSGVAVTSLTAPVITGSTTVGSVLTVAPGTYGGSTPITIAHQWRRNGVNIIGETGLTYTTLIGDLGLPIDVVETATNEFGVSVVDSNDIVVTSATPTAPIAGMRAWFDASQESYGDVDPVPSVTDWSGNGFNINIAAPAAPFFFTNIINSHPVIRFSGVNQALNRNFVMFPSAADDTWFVVLHNLPSDVDVTTPQFVFDTGDDGTAGRRFMVLIKTGGGAYQIEAGRDMPGVGFGTIDYVPGESVVVTVRLDGTNSFIRLNGNPLRQTNFTVSNTPAASASSFRLGAYNAANLYFLHADFVEGVLYTSAMSDPNIALNEAYLLAKYALPPPPPPVSGFMAWYDASQIGGLNDSNPVGTWYDLSGNGHNLTAAGSTRPLYKVNILNGLPAVQFDGIDDSMSIAGIVFSGGAPRTIFMVVAPIVQPPAMNQKFWFDTMPSLGPASRRVLNFDTFSGFQIRFGNSYLTAFLPVTAGESLLVASQDVVGGVTTWRINGDPLRQNTLPFFADGSPDLGLGRVGSAYNGSLSVALQVCELLVYGGSLSDPDFASVETYLKTKYGIP